MTLTTHPIHRRGLRKSRTIPLLPLWAFVACSRVTFTFTLNDIIKGTVAAESLSFSGRDQSHDAHSHSLSYEFTASWTKLSTNQVVNLKFNIKICVYKINTNIMQLFFWLCFMRFLEV